MTSSEVVMSPELNKKILESCSSEPITELDACFDASP